MSSRKVRGSALALLSLLSLVFSTAAMAQAVDHYEYEKDRIYPVRTGLGLTTQIELSPNEKILDYSTGFSSGCASSSTASCAKPNSVSLG